ncbi:COPB1 [Cordylochernes scorpioides]|uniref:Coatomer subunit beta n=1 Tax=Cordylochernes scorpioides TaxID=51811 RepID=A0ABY6LIH0_9ARAC|nr:COPB1 [Cordylochernes scorpioides]
MLNGERLPSLLMTIMRYVLPNQDHTIKKLLLIFWEIVPKTSPDGKLLHEMILVCDAYRKDLQHPNEFIRGSTLRFLCKLKEPELLEPIMPSIRACLDHRHSYVRRNAVLAIFTIYKNFDFLIPDAPELIASFLEQEQNQSCKRNAFMMLVHVDQERALAYLSSCIDQVHSFGDILQLVIVELIYKVCHANPSERSRFIRCIYNLLNSSSPSVRYEAAGTLVTLSTAPTAIKAAASCYIDLIVKESDNNVKLIVLDRLIALKASPSTKRVLQELAMDVLHVLASSDLEVRRKTLELALDLVSSRNVKEMVLVMMKEVSKTHGGGDQEDTGKYRQLLVRTLHSCCVRFPDVAHSIIPELMEFLGEKMAAEEVLILVREAIQRFDSLRPHIVSQLLEAFPSISCPQICRSAMWILGEYCCTVEEIQSVMTELRQSLGPIPMVEEELRKATKGDMEQDVSMTAAVPWLVTADGTYATQSALSNMTTKTGYLMDGDFFVGAALASSLVKLALRYVELVQDPVKQNRRNSRVQAMSEDDADRISLCLKVLSEQSPDIVKIFHEECRRALDAMLTELRNEELETERQALKKQDVMVQPDSTIMFPQLASKNELAGTENIFEVSLSQAVGKALGGPGGDSSHGSKLSKVTQLTGFSDPVYAEAYVHVNQYDIVLDVLVVNQTPDTLQNCTLELATLGDLKLVEKPSPVILAPHDFCNIKASVKVASTENGIIFGNIVYDVSGCMSDRNVVVLNDLHIDIMDYIVPASCSDMDFWRMWAEFEWENKVMINTPLTDLRAYLQHLITWTNMRCLTPEKKEAIFDTKPTDNVAQALSGECCFLAANLYARSIFGEDALANVSVEQDGPGGQLTGHIKIRAKSQGMALSLGEKINQTQKAAIKTGG